MSSVQVILLQDLPALGNLGDVVRVKRGYARNHLLPAGKAQSHTSENIANFAKLKEQIVKRQKESRAALEKAHGELDGYLLQAVEHASDQGALYGSITVSKIVDLLKAQGHDIKRNQIMLPEGEPIKNIGEYDVTIKLGSALDATIKLAVLSDQDHS